MSQKFKYCSYYDCGRLLPDDFEGDTCPHCKHVQYSWDRKKWIKPLPAEAYEVEMKCRKCGSTEDLKYNEKRTYGSDDQYSYGNEFECKPCYDAFKLELKRQEAMNFIIINDDEPYGEFHINKEAVEEVFEKYLQDYYEEGNPFEEWVILKVEALKNGPEKKDFINRNILLHGDDWYRVEEIIEPEYEFTGEHNVNW